MMPWMRKKNGMASASEADRMYVSDFSLRTERRDVSKKPEAANFGSTNARPMRPEDTEVTIPSQMYCTLIEEADYANKIVALIERTLANSGYTMEELMQERSGCHLAVMTEAERDGWQQLKHVSAITGNIDCMQTLRESMTGMARVAKQLELRFDAPADEGVRQQHSFDRLAYDAEQLDPRDRNEAGMLARLNREAEALLYRMQALLSKAEAGVVPFCSHVMNLGGVCDAEANSGPNGELTALDIVKGRSVSLLLASTLRHIASFRHGAVNGSDLARATWSRCDDRLRAQLGGEPRAADGQPGSLLRRWLKLSGTREFHHEQVQLARNLQAHAQAIGSCRYCLRARRS